MAKTDILGAPVENYKMKVGVPPLLGKIRKTQQKIKMFQVFKDLMQSKIKMMDEQLIGEGKRLLSLMPEDPMRDLQGMSAPDEGRGFEENGSNSVDMQLRY